MFWKKYLNLKLEIFIQIFTNLYGIENARFLFLLKFVTAFFERLENEEFFFEQLEFDSKFLICNLLYV
jgi:hypothetical protein